MRGAVVKIKTSVEIIAFVILVQFCRWNTGDEKLSDDTRILRKTCLLKPQMGPCRSNIAMYYFNPDEGTCRKFSWGGCQGNGNRFDTKEECYSSCLGNISALAKYRPRYCFLNFDYGFCFGGIPRYYYDPLWKVCKERLYSGCGGNKNNFYNIEQCNAICRYGTGFIKSLKMKKGQVKKVIIVNPAEALTTTKTNHHLQTRKATGATAAADKT